MRLRVFERYAVVSVAWSLAACGGESGSGEVGRGGGGGVPGGGGATNGPSASGMGGGLLGGSSSGGSGGNGGVSAGTSSGGVGPGSGGAFSNGGTTSSAGQAGTTLAGSNSAGGGAMPSDGGASGRGGGANGGSATGGTKSASGGSAGSTASGGTTAGSGPPETSPRGYGQGTTGGGSKAIQKASTLEQMQALIDDYAGSGGLSIEYTGRFEFATITDPCTQHSLPAKTLEIKRKSDITILGADGSSANFGIHIASTSKNIIVRNMTIGLTPGADGSDIISIEGMSDGAPSDVWVDHNEFFTSLAECDGAGDTEFDGMLDVKKGADNITVSYNHFHDHQKVSLNGSSDTDTAVRHITFHHNLIEKVGSRIPLQRGGYSHLFNNVFSDVRVSGINVRMGGYALIEANYFEDVKNPVTSRDSDEVGFWDLRGNNLASASDVATGNAFHIIWDEGNDGTVNATDWKTTKAFPVALGYAYTADPFDCVRSGLRAVAGAGKGFKTLKCN